MSSPENKNDAVETLFFAKGSKVEVSSDQEGFEGAWYIATVIDPPSKTKTTSYLVEYETLLADEEEDGSKPLRELVEAPFLRPLAPKDDENQRFELNDVVDGFYRDGWWTGVVTGVYDKGSKFAIFFQNPPEKIELPRSELRVHRQWVDGKWVRPELKEIINPPSDNLEKSAPMSTKKKQNRATSDTNSTSPPPLKKSRKRYTEEANLGEEDKRIDCSKQSVVGDRIFAKTKSSWEKKYEISEPKGGVSTLGKRKGRPPNFLINEWKEGEKSSERKRRGRPPNLSIKESKEGKTSPQDKCSFKLSKECQEILDNHSTHLHGLPRGNDLLSDIMKMHAAEKDTQLNGTIVKLKGKRSKKHASRKQLRKSITEKSGPSCQDTEKGPTDSEKNCSTKGVEVFTDELPGNVFDDQPAIVLLEGKNSQTPTDGSRSFPGKTVDPCVEEGTRRDKIEICSPPVLACENMTVDDNQRLPFQKSSRIWESIESLEVFKTMPQKPHFRPLDTCDAYLREGFAVAKMVTFANVVESTSKLKSSDPKSIIDSCLKILSELKTHGFDIGLVEDRLKELLLMKERQEQLEEESKEVEREIAKQSLEKTKIDEEIREIAKMISELQEKLALVTSKEEMEDREIVTLQMELVVTCEALKKVQFDFEKLAASPW